MWGVPDVSRHPRPSVVELAIDPELESEVAVLHIDPVARIKIAATAQFVGLYDAHYCGEEKLPPGSDGRAPTERQGLSAITTRSAPGAVTTPSDTIEVVPKIE